ncbi:caspase family protein [Microseira sp. BLCC-F43]|jgi:uncharacterized caspase-like protein|uniref:caspase family protein n=1 Tax=Microseira sp. BLCC-F43 TaxID=3153602 RepID=UPI0035B91D07
MSNHWLLAIGINQYQHFQPLNFAQADAQALWNYLVGKTGFMPDRCLLLTDTSPFVEGQSTYPSKANLQKWIDWLCKDGQGSGSPLGAGDVVWCFFSGYGVTWEGQDYLMPIDGNAANIANTGIAVRSLFEGLKTNPAVMPLVLLDIKHPPFTSVGVGTGTQTLELARDMQIPTLLSCQPNQSAGEAADLHHGLFAQSLIEALRTGAGTTLADLSESLRGRLPALSEQYSLPRQDPAIVVQPPENMDRGIIPYNGQAVNANSAGNQHQAQEGGVIAATISPSLAAVKQHMQNVSTIPGASGAQNPFEEALNRSEPGFAEAPPAVAPASGQPTPAPAGNVATAREGSFWQRLLLWTGGVLLLLLVLVSIFGRGREAARQGAGSNRGTVPTLSDPGSPEQRNQARLKQATTLLQSNQVAQFSRAIGLASQIKPGEPLYDEAQQAIARWSQVIFETAQGRAEKGNFEAAIAAASLVPKDQPIHEEAQKLIALWRGAAKKQQTNRNTLQAAKKLVQPGQASSYNQAIDLVRQIPAGEPGSAEAKQLTNQWSQSILNLAQSRASEGFINQAIETASLVPNNTPAYPKAKAAIEQWKRQLSAPKK